MKTPNGNAGIIDSSITKKTPNNIPVFCNNVVKYVTASFTISNPITYYYYSIKTLFLKENNVILSYVIYIILY